MRCRDDEDLALDRIDAERKRGPAHLEPAHAGASVARPSVVELQAELTQLRERIGQYPEHLVDQLHAARSARAEAQRVADEARARIAELEPPARGVLRRRAADSAERALQCQRLKLAEGEIAAAAERERNLQAGSPTGRHGRPSAARSASAPPSSTRSSRAAAASICASRSSDQLPTSQKRSALSRNSRALAAPGSKPPRASRPTASTTPSPTTATRWGRHRATGRARALATRPPRPPTRSTRPRASQRAAALPRGLSARTGAGPSMLRPSQPAVRAGVGVASLSCCKFAAAQVPVVSV